MSDILLGLEIGSRYIKAVLVKQGRKTKIVGADLISTPEGSVSDGALVFLDPIAECIKSYIAKSGVKPAAIAVSVNSPEAFVVVSIKAPTASTLTPATYSPVRLLTFPVTVLVSAIGLIVISGRFTVPDCNWVSVIFSVFITYPALDAETVCG